MGRSCDLCNVELNDDIFIEFDGHAVCPQCKPIAVQRLKEGTPLVESKVEFLYISILRLVSMSILTVGIYQAYWIYKNWKFYKQRERLRIMPFWRGIFGIFFIHRLFKKIANDSATNTILRPDFNPSTLATIWVIIVVLKRIIDRLPVHDAFGILVLFLSLISVVCFIPVQKYINAVIKKSSPNTPYYHWSIGHIVMIVLGCLLWLLVLVGLVAIIVGPGFMAGGGGGAAFP